MKKTLLPLIFLPLVFTSCIFIPQNDNAKNEQKTTYKSFEDLNDPLILSYNQNLDFALYGNENLAWNTVYHGSILMIYDWENEKVHDYVYAPGVTGDSYNQKIVPAAKVDGTTKYYFADYEYKVVYEIDSSKTELKNISLDERNRFATRNWADNRNVNSKYMLRYMQSGYDEEDYSAVYKFEILDAAKGEFKTPIEFKNPSSDNLQFCYSPSDDAYWFSYETAEDKQTHKSSSVIKKVNCEENKIEDEFISFERNTGKTYDEIEGWNALYTYKVLSTSSDYLLLGKTVYADKAENKEPESLIAVNKKDKTTKTFAINLSTDFAISENVVCINDVFYVFCRESISDSNKMIAYKLNPATDTALTVLKSFDFDNEYFATVRGSRIYFVKYENSENSITVIYFNTADSTFSESKTIKLTDFAE